MQKLVKVTYVGNAREGVSQKTGKEWSMTDIDVEWTVEQPGTEPYKQSCVGTVRGYINLDVLNEYKEKGKEILVTMYVQVRTWENRHFTNVEIYLPKEMMLEAKPL